MEWVPVKNKNKQKKTRNDSLPQVLHIQTAGGGDQNLHDFVTELKKWSSECEFNNLQDSLMKDIIICGTKDHSLHECLLQECDLIAFQGFPNSSIGWLWGRGWGKSPQCGFIRNFWEIFLPGGENLRSDFDDSNLFSKLKTTLYEYWTSIKISLTCVSRVRN